MVDIYYKVKALSEIGVRINLHCFMHRNNKYSEELYELCDHVYYYKMDTFLSDLSLIPGIVNSRRSENLLFNLQQNDYPVLFEGIHTCYYLSASELKERKKIVRIQDVEPEYYDNLHKLSHRYWDRLLLKIESRRLRKYEQILSHADTLVTLNIKHKEYYENLFPEKEIINIEPFSAFSNIAIKEGMGSYALYHSNLTEPDNIEAVIFLVKEVIVGTGIPLIVAGKNPDSDLKHLCKDHKVKILANPSDEKLDELIRNAQVNILVSFMPSGSKSKIYPALYHGRHCLVNSNMVRGFSYTDACHVADSAEELRTQLFALMQEPFTSNEIERRTKILGRTSVEKKIELLSKLF